MTTEVATTLSKTVEKIEKTTKERGEKLIQLARNHYGSMARSWWEFAKVIVLVKESKSYEEVGCESFKEWCGKEFPTIDDKILLKLSLIVDEWYEAIENRLKKDENFRLPAYESCYRLLTAKDRMPEIEVTKLKKELLDEKLSFGGLIDKIKSIAKPKEVKKVSKVDADALERELVGDIDDEELEEFEDDDKKVEAKDDDLDSADDIFDEDITDVESDDKSTELLEKVRRHLDALNDNLPLLTESIEGIADLEVTGNFAEALDNLMDSSEKIFAKLEEAQS